MAVLLGVSMKNLPYFSFVDKRLHEEWSVDGLHQFYVPKGIVTHISYYPMDGKGEEVGVLYTSPSGVLFREWRTRDEIEISEINDVEWSSQYELFTAKQMTHRRGVSLRYSAEQTTLDVH